MNIQTNQLKGAANLIYWGTEYMSMYIVHKGQKYKVKFSFLDIDKVKNIRWSISGDKSGILYVKNNSVGYMHRYLKQPGQGYVVDHMDHNTLNNRRNNLRICTTAENNANRSDASLHIAGVYKSGNKWRVLIRKGQKHYFSCTRETLDEAIQARLMGEIQLGLLSHQQFYEFYLTTEEIEKAVAKYLVNLENGQQLIETINTQKIINLIREVA